MRRIKADEAEYVTVVNGMNHPKYTEVCDADRRALENGFKWCLHCKRAYPTGNFRYDKNEPDPIPQMFCPYDNCDGDYWMDGWVWLEIANDNGYPSIPKLGKIYALYPEVKE